MWFWIAQVFLWQTLLLQFPIKRPSAARWVMLACLLLGEMIFYVGATLECLLRITFIGELSYVCAPKGDELSGDTISGALAPEASTSSNAGGSSGGSRSPLGS